MKKFLMGLLGVFLLFGASILSACTSSGTNLVLSKETVEIQIYAGEEESFQTVTAEVLGTDKASISANAKSSYESIVKVSTSKISETKVSIKIEGLNEGEAEITVKSGNQTKYIHATVFSEVSEMTQKTEDGNKKKNFLVRGQNNVLEEEDLINFYPSEKSRRTITWSLTDTVFGATLNGNSLNIDNNCVADNISLLATTEKGVETIINLPVLDKIDQTPNLSFSYSKNASFEKIEEENNTFSIVPNVPNDEKYTGYVLVDYSGDLEITGYALDDKGNLTDDIQINRDGSLNGSPVFAIFANKEKTNINNTYTIGFKIGYAQYDYSHDTLQTLPITITARELVNGVIISTSGSGNIENSTQTLYTEYADSDYSTAYGQEFNIMMIPTTVVDATNKYSITLSRTEAGGAIADGCPIEIWFRDFVNGGVWTYLPLVEDADGNFVTNRDALPSVSTIYIKASSTLKEQTVQGLTLTFTSADNTNISSSFNLKLVRSVSAGDFVFPNGEFKIDSSVANVSYRKQFTLKGQTSVEGLYIINNSKAVTFDNGDKVHYISHDEESVTFEIILSLNKSSYGATTLDTYQIAHKNGLVSDEMAIDIFLPLKEAGMFIDSANDLSNSIIDSEFDDKTYNLSGEIVEKVDNESLSQLMLKNQTATPVIYLFNEINGISALANVSVNFFDFNEGEDELERFLSLAQSPEGIAEILAKSKGNTLSSIAYFTSDYSSIITKGVGHTYAVVAFTGKGTENTDLEGNVTLVRILRIESLITPEGMNIAPDADKNVELYSIESLAMSDENLTSKDIKINFVKSNVTYKDVVNLNFYSRNEVMGKKTISGDGKSVVWENGRYTVSNIVITDEGISFTISALHTYGEYAFADTLDVHYSIYNSELNKVYDISSSIKITISNAQRIESLVWDNYDKNGLYFELGNTSPQYMIFKTNPTNAKNKNIAFIPTDVDGVVNTSFVQVSNAVSDGTLAVNLASGLIDGMTGYLYILPADAIYNNQIKYYYLENNQEKAGYVPVNSLGLVINTDGQTNYDYLVENAYFKSSVTANQINNVSFKEIILKIKITVADGKNFEHAYRIFDQDGFNAIMPDKYYTIMNSLEIDSTRVALENFNGGLQGDNQDVTIKFNGSNFANIIAKDAEIRNIKFHGQVNGGGFVANVNNGKISNVTVDVDSLSASKLSVADVYGGGIVGINNGIINGAKVLGLDIEGGVNSIVGGIAGQNKGSISNSSVEFYNLKIGENTFGSNKITGNIVGAIVGEILAGSSISMTYAYDWTMKDGENVLQAVGENVKLGAFAGIATVGAEESAQINYSFAVVNQMALYNNGTYNSNVKMTNYYNSYYFTGTYTVDYVAGYESNPNFVKPTDDNYDSQVNGENNYYLKDLQQPKKVSSVSYNVATVENNGYYKSVAVDETKGILFYYQLKNSFVELNSAEKNDLDALNTITLSQLVGEEGVGENIIITSSDISKIKVVGSTMIIRSVGEVAITLSSKQNVEFNKTISIQITSPLSAMQITWADVAGNVNFIEENSQISIQKTRSRDFYVSFDRPQVFLGALATAYDIVENDYLLSITSDIDINAVLSQGTNKNQFKLISQENSLLTTFNVAPQIFKTKANDSQEVKAIIETYQNAVNAEFTRSFKVLPTEGLISFALSDETISISPSVNSSVQVEIKTTAEADGVYPVVYLDEEELSISGRENIFYFTRLAETTPILEAVVTPTSQSTSNGVSTYVFAINFAVAEDYKANISQEYDFEVVFMSMSGNSSEEWGGKLNIHLSQQDFTNIDVSNRKITTPHYKFNQEGSLVEVWTTDKATAVLAPGNSSILEVNVNPQYANYDYVELSYSGATVSNAINAVVAEPFNGSKTDFTRKEIKNNNIETINTKVVYRPQPQDKSTIFYKIWVNTTVNSDTTIRLTATFFRNGGVKIDHVNYYLTVSYLIEPTITVDGSNTTYLAKGSSAEIKIDVLLDQQVDSLTIEGENVEGVSISQLSTPEIDTARGIKTYTATIYATVLASTSDANTFYLRARVSRELNGAKEIKDSIATVVLVDFKIDTSSISISNSKDGNLTLWQGISKPVLVGYDLLPESYPYPSTPEMAAEIEKLRNARESFEANQCYPLELNEDSKYIINYTYDSENGYQKQRLVDRLFIVINNEHFPISDSSIDKPFGVIVADDGSVSFEGTRISGAVQMVLKTYITSNYVTQVIETPFAVTVEAYSDPDLPIKISTASDFNNLNPEGISAGVELQQNDYILENDIVLENFKSFNTDLISSFDGNGKTIYIKSFDTEDATSTLNLALFNSVKDWTTLKNVRVNLYNGGQITVNVSKVKNINVAGLAISNAGVITNCEVVSFYSTDRAVGEEIADSASIKHNEAQGINIKYVNAEGTDEVYLPDNANWTSQVAGFVIENSGSITNSRVGGDEIIIIGDNKVKDGKATGYTYASTLKLDNFNIVGQGNIAGFVISNSGYITSSYVQNIDIENKSNSISFYTAGFAGVNNSAILTSFVEGAPSVEENMPNGEYSKYAFEGTSIRSRLGYIVGFIYNNMGSVKDSYSNILIANSVEATRVYYASGFVYMNDGMVENCYSASQITNSKFSQMNFSGVNESGELLKSGEYINCYFFNKAFAGSEDPNEPTTEIQYQTGAQLISKPDEVNAFYGFAIADGENDGIWRTDEERGIALIEANKTTVSHRYTNYVADEFDGITAEDSQGRKYNLPYSILTFIGSAKEIDTSLGSDNNPILVYDAQDFMEICGTSQSSYVQQYFNDKAIWGSYRLVHNINLLDVASGEDTVALPSSTKAFAGRLYGNGFTISGISISANSKDVAFGLFKSIERRGQNLPIVTNLDLVISQVVAGDVVLVGGLAGYIKDAIIINLDLQFDAQSSTVSGLNFVGGLAGLATGSNIIKNITLTNPTAIAERRAEDEEEGNYFKSVNEIQLFRTNLANILNYNASINTPFIRDEMQVYSYAGALIGYVDNYQVNYYSFDINQIAQKSINNIRVQGKVSVQGQVVGGVLGFTGYQTHVNDIGLTIDTTLGDSKILSTKYFAGGVIGQSFGGVSRTFAVYDKATQEEIEDNMSAFYKGNTQVQRGQLDIFSETSSNYTQEYIGGLIGYVGSGKLEVSYSKLNVTSPSAKYAGGIIGGVEVSNASTYQTDSTRAYEPAWTKYFIHEVYATGDVRAKINGEGYAGGVIGVIKGEGSRVALLAVNGFNYLTTYDYANQRYISLDSSVSNMSSTIKVNSLVGYFINNDGDVVYCDATNYASYLIFMKAGESVTSDSSAITMREVASIGVYQAYYNDLTVNMFGVVDSRISDNNILYNSGHIFVIAKPINFENSTIGHTYTQSGFINSGAWNSDTWTHLSTELFPEIRYKRSYEVLYLDQYNIAQVFAKMNSNVKVVVRGRINEESDVCGDVDLREYFKINPTGLIQSFSGILQGGEFKTVDENGQERDVRIKTDRTFIASTGPGFSINNVTIDYIGTAEQDGKTYINISNGLLSQSSISEAGISGLTINLDSPVKASLGNTDDNNIGLIAPIIESTNVVGVTINQANTTEYLLQVEGTDVENVHIGLLAGQALQKSQISSMIVEDINFNLGNIISLTKNNKVKNTYVGTYFGLVDRTLSAQPLSILFNDLVNSSSTSDASGERKASIAVNNSTGENLFLGGYIGSSTGVEFYGFDNEEDCTTSVEFNIGNGENIDNIFVGGLLATVDKTIINGKDFSAGADVQTSIFAEKAKNIYAGGVLASTLESAGNIKLLNMTNVSLEVASNRINKEKNNFYKNSLSGNYDLDNNGQFNANYVEVSGEALVGSVAGRISSEFNYLTDSTINSQGESIRLSGNNIVAGSVVGQSGTSTEIAGNIVSYAEFMVNSAKSETNKVIVGGMVGSSDSGTVTIKGENQGLVNFIGSVYSNADSLIFGGMIGNLKDRDAGSADYISIRDTSFGGVVKVYGENSNNADVAIGGTIGIIPTMKALITNNYNYGDVFVDYDSIRLSQLNSYKFGGLIADSAQLTLDGTLDGTSETLNCTLADNYSLVTSHNSRYSTVNSTTANALFGNGSPWSDTSSIPANYYNHAVCLLVDRLGTDVGYASGYDKANGQFGYGEYQENLSIASTIKSKLSSNIVINNAHKLSPADFEQMGENGEELFNGLYYYSYNGENQIAEMNKEDERITSFDNLALIGSFNTSESYTISNSLVEELKGHSFISGIARNVKIIEENAQERTYSPLVEKMSGNAIVYAVQITGLYELGGDSSASLSGIVGDFQSGKIFDSSTEIDLVYRAGEMSESNGIFAIANSIDSSEENANNFKLIENTYASGSLESMVKTNMFAFTNGTGNTNIANCYTFAKLDPKDYLNDQTQVGKIGAFGLANTQKALFDADGLNYVLNATEKGTVSKRSVIKQNFASWETNPDFNYGYPTLDYQYLKTSSYVKDNGSALQCSNVEGHDHAGEVYDCYVETHTYTRYANGTLPTKEGESIDEYYYLVPNAAVMYATSIADTDIDSGKGIVLKYNMDFSVYGTTDGYGKENSDRYYEIGLRNFPNTMGEFSKIFDGQNKTIKGLKETSLFSKLSGATVRNLRLTDVEFENMPALATTIENGSTISNMTFSGNVSFTTAQKDNSASNPDNSYYAYGSIANVIEGSTINTSTNMINLVVRINSDNKYHRVGGLFGRMEGSTIAYTSNYGPVRMLNQKDGYNINVGGLVGFMTGSSTIKYSYNTASVLGNYADSSALATTKGTFITGGIAGYIGGGQISDCYNTGMIKSGNKTNNTISKAGGIVGEASAGTISNVYNEGTVEALATNPTWFIKDNKDEKTNETTSISLVIDGDRNVWAYGIGRIVEEASLSDAQIKLVDENDYESIKQNGNPYDSETILKTWTIEDIYSDYASAANYDEEWTSELNMSLFGWGWIKVTAKNTIKVATSHKIDLSRENIKITALNEYEIPSRIIVPVLKKVKVNFDYSHVLPIVGTENFPDEREVELFEFGVADFDLTNDDYYQNQYKEENRLNNNDKVGSILENLENQEIKNLTRSQEQSPATVEDNVTKIAGKEFYKVDSNNAESIFNAGTYSYKFVGENALEFGNVDYFANLDYYDLTAIDSNGIKYDNIGVKLLNMKAGENNGVVVEAQIYSQVAFPEDLTLKLEFNYEKSVRVDLSNLDYYYVDDYSFGIDINGINPSQLKEYSISTSEGTNYDKVIRISTVQYNTNENNIEPLDYGNASYIYLAVKDGQYIYIPNATLHKEGKEDIVVNKSEYIAEEETLDATKTKNIIENIFDGKTLYYRVAKGSYSDVSIASKLTDYASSSLTWTAGEDKLFNKTLNYGNKISTSLDNFNVEFVTIETPVEVPPTEQPTEGEVTEGEGTDGDQTESENPTVTYEYYYKLSLTDLLTQDFLGVDGGTPVLSYNANSSTLGLSFATLNVAGLEMEVTIEENAIIFRNESISAEDSNVVDGIKNYFNNLEYITNSELNDSFEIKDAFSDIQEGEKLIELKSGDKLLGKVNSIISKAWSFAGQTLNEGENIQGAWTITKTGNNLSVALNGANEDLTQFSLNGVTIYYGSLSVENIKESYSTRLGSVTLYAPTGENNSNLGLQTYYSLSLSGTNSKTNEGFMTVTSGGHGAGKVLGEDPLTGENTINLVYYSTYQEKSFTEEETGVYKLALKDQTGSYFMEVDFSGETQKDPTQVIQVFDSYAFYMNVSTGITEDGEEYKEYIFNINNGNSPFSINNEEYDYLTIRKYSNRTTYIYSYTEVKDADGNVTDYLANEMTEKPAVIFNGQDVFSVMESLSNKSFENVLNRKESTDGKKYIYSSSFEILDSLTWEGKILSDNGVIDATITKNSKVNTYVYDYVEFVCSDYLVENITMEFEDLDISILNNSPYIINGKNIEIYLKNAGFEIFNLSKSQNDQVESISVETEEPDPAYSVIFLDDISLNANILENADRVNFIGNGYYISYFNDSLFETLNNNGAFFKDISFLGEVYNKALFNLTKNEMNSTPLVFNNTNFYGSVNNLQGSDAIINSSEISIKNSSIYISANGLKEEKEYQALSLFGDNATIEEVRNFGSIIGADGKKGINGDNIDSATSGDNGYNGQSIVATRIADSSNISIENKGIVKTGDGGNGGAGGSYQIDGHFDSAGGNGGSAGSVGENKGFDNTLSFVSQAKTGSAGVGIRSSYYSSEIGYAADIEAVNTEDTYKFSDAPIPLQIKYNVFANITIEQAELTKNDYDNLEILGSKISLKLTDSGEDKIMKYCFTGGNDKLEKETQFPESLIENITVK